MKPEDCVLYSGAANGAEAAFGAAAERHGIDEVNFTFEGHNDARTRGLRVLTHEELRQGDVSLAYVSRLMHREYRDTDLFKKVLQSIWHQVNNGQEIYVVGQIQVFDQVKDGWHRWVGDAWEAHAGPVITHPHITGTGTRFLKENGTKAIDDLFKRSFS